jgi:hypothetical protein
MDEQQVRERAQAVCTALVAGDVEAATRDFSDELRRNLGEVLALLPLPSNEATVESIDSAGHGSHTVVLRLVGEREEVQLQTRWKERDGRVTIVEASHLSRAERASGEGAAGLDSGDADEAESAAPG